MTNMMYYKGYAAKIEYDDDDGLLYGDVVDLSDSIVFSGASVEELRASFERAVDTYLEWCEERGEEPAKQFSGKIHLRLPPALHRAATIAAAEEGESVNTYLVTCVERALAASPVVVRAHVHLRLAGLPKEPSIMSWGRPQRRTFSRRPNSDNDDHYEPLDTTTYKAVDARSGRQVPHVAAA